MIRNYVTIALRNMLRQKGYTLINVVGLSLGLATAILMLRYIQSEFNVDRWHSKGDRIYSVLREIRSGGESTFYRGVSGGLAAAIEQNFPGVEETVRIFPFGADVEYAGQHGRLNICIADATIFKVFDYSFVSGSAVTAFSNPNSMAITRSEAQRLFGNDDPIGKTLSVKQEVTSGDFTITAILEDIPFNTTLRFGAVVTQPNPSNDASVNAWEGWAGNFSWRPVRIYVLVREGVDINPIRARISSLIDRFMGPEIARNNDYHLQPFREAYLYSRRDYNIGRADITRVYQFAAIATIVLVIACINFTNLSTARSRRRAGEVGLRKVTGAYRSQLIGQFLGESILTSLLASILSVVLVKLAIPEFNALFNRQVTLDLTAEPWLVGALLVFAVVVGTAAGAYPALFLSAFQPSDTLKGTHHPRSSGQWIRKALVVVQFAISIVLLIGTGVVYQQMHYVMTKDLGYDTSQLLTLSIFSTDQGQLAAGAPKLADRYNVVKQAFLNHPNVLDACAYRWKLGRSGGMKRSVGPEGHEGTDWRMPVLEVDEDFLDFFDIKLVSGRKFDLIRFPADTSHAFILNETAVKILGWDAHDPGEKAALGKAFKWEDPYRRRVGQVVGVVRDFHYGPLRSRIGPAALHIRNKQFYQLALRVLSEHMDDTLSFLEETWTQFAPINRPFSYEFWDQQFERMYREESRVQSLTLWSSGIAISLACLGLFGLASYATEERRKEIGVRKTLGATTRSVVALVSREFIVMVLIAAAIATPVAWTVSRGWLDNFAYRTDLGPTVFILGAAVALIIAQLTVTFHAYRAARTDPVLALRDE